MYQPSGLLTDQEFMLLQGLLGSGYDGLVRCQESLESGLLVVTYSMNVTVELDMLYAFDANANDVNTVLAKDLMSRATLSLLRHVETRGGQEINDYLYARQMKVTRRFAELSSGLGYTIDAENIEA